MLHVKLHQNWPCGLEMMFERNDDDGWMYAKRSQQTTCFSGGRTKNGYIFSSISPSRFKYLFVYFM